MKKITLITTIILTANLLFGQLYNKIDTSFFSEALQEEKLVDVYFPPGYDENPDLYYPVIYYLHYWSGDQNSMGSEMMSWTQSLINNGTIDPVIMVGADNSPEPFNGSCYINSTLWGNYEDYMTSDLLNWIESSFRAMPGRDYRAVMGLSMGAYGSFRFGILHKDKFKALAACAGPICFDVDIYLETCRQQIMLENQPGPPFSYYFENGPQFTRAFFLFCGAASPNLNSQQAYIDPQIINYAFDENANFIDSVVLQLQEYDAYELIQQLTPEDSVGIYFGCGTEDSYLLHPSHLAMKDRIESLGLPYEFYSFDGPHYMPGPFKQRALTFIDSLLFPPTPYTAISDPLGQLALPDFDVFPNPFTQFTTIQYELFENSSLKLEIWNHLGQNVKILYKGYKNPGIHQLRFDASMLPDGIYFCQLKVGNEMVTKKIIKL